MSAGRPSIICERVRAQVSVSLDGELSQLERAMLEAHLGRCVDCRAYGADVTAFTRALREAPPEPLERPVVVRRRPFRVAALRVPTAAAAAMALGVVGVASQLAADRPGGGALFAVQTAVHFPTQGELSRELTLLEIAQPGGELPKGGNETLK